MPHIYPFTHAFVDSLIHSRWWQPCNATASLSGAVGVRCLVQGPPKQTTFRLPGTLLNLLSQYCSYWPCPLCRNLTFLPHLMEKIIRVIDNKARRNLQYWEYFEHGADAVLISMSYTCTKRVLIQCNNLSMTLFEKIIWKVFLYHCYS